MIPENDEDVLDPFDLVPAQSFNKRKVPTERHTQSTEQAAEKHDDLARRLQRDENKKQVSSKEEVSDLFAFCGKEATYKKEARWKIDGGTPLFLGYVVGR